MAVFFYDTSAFVKYFTSEAGSAGIIRLIDDPANETQITELTLTEYYCALHRKFRNKQINEIQLNEAIQGFDADINRYNIEDITSYTFLKSKEYVLQFGQKYGLRTLDAIQIAAFVLIADQDWTFVAADSIPCDMIAQLGFNVFNPISEQRSYKKDQNLIQWTDHS